MIHLSSICSVVPMKRYSITIYVVIWACCLGPGVATANEELASERVAESYLKIAHQRYEDALDATVELSQEVRRFLQSPSEESHQKAKDAWITAHETYSLTEVFRFGNPNVDEWETKVNAWPIDEGFLDYVSPGYSYEGGNPHALFNLIGSEFQIDDGYIVEARSEKDPKAGVYHGFTDNETNVATGYHTIEFLLWGQDLNQSPGEAGQRPYTDYVVGDVTAAKAAIGRFGWKAEQPTVRQQVAAAFHGDIGITSTVFPQEPLSESQENLLKLPHGGSPELSNEILDFVTFYSKTLAVPAQRAHDSISVIAGRKLFQKAKCNLCHVESFVTGDNPDFPELSSQEIHPFTDLLLHDMGEGLSDGRPVFSANGQEWRTAPLWGVGLSFHVSQEPNFLHDGRARNLEEAILWHGGEAEESREIFRNMSSEERGYLLSFLKSL